MALWAQPGRRERWAARRARAGGLLAGLLAVAWSTAGARGQALEPPPAVGPTLKPPTAQPPEALAPDSPYEGRLIAEVRFEGLSREPPSLVENQLRTQIGRPYAGTVVAEDLRRLYRLGRFWRVSASVELREDGAVTVVYRFEEAPVIEDVAVAGNQRLSNEEIGTVVTLVKGTFVDEHSIDQARRAIEDLYKRKGFPTAQVTVDEGEIKEGVVLFRVREGPRVRVTAIRFEGVTVFSAGTLRRQIRTKTAGLLQAGPLDEETVDSDVSSLIRYYLDHGYLDVRVDREVTISPNAREAILTFIVDEGPRHRLRSIQLVKVGEGEGPPIISAEQAAGIMEIKPGDVYSVDKLKRSVDAVRNAYWRMGYIDARVSSEELRAVDSAEIDLALSVREGERYRTGEVIVQGNTVTKQNVILRSVRVTPDRPLDRTALLETEQRLNASRLFRRANPADPTPGVTVTVQPEDPAAPGYRDVLIQVSETNTGSINFGAAISSDSGVIGTIGITQNNFDIGNPPLSWEELIRGESFRGAGQVFNLSLAPGTEVQTYSIGLTEPSLFETNTSAGGSLSYRTREYTDYDEDRFTARTRLGRAFGDVWTAGLALRAERVELSDINNSAPVEYFESAGPSTYFGLGMDLTRTTVPLEQRFSPTEGARTALGVEQVFGDWSFTRLSAEHSVFLPVYEDTQGRRGVLSLKTTASWIPQTGEAPVYETFYLGGQSFRGFDFRGISTHGRRQDNGELSDDPVGGDWLFFAGVEYQHPIWGLDPTTQQATIALVLFVDSGTVTNNPGFDEYRVSAGFGLRLRTPVLGPAPLAFDFGFPIKEQDLDQTRLFTFSIDLPF